MEIIGFLILAPLVIAALLLVLRQESARAVVVIAGAVALMFGALALAVTSLLAPPQYFSTQTFSIDSELISHITLVVDVVVCLYVIYRGVRHNNYLAVLLAGIQAVVVLILELIVAPEIHTVNDIYVDQLSIIMALIIAIIGGGICIYAIGYMRDFQKHANEHAALNVQDGDPSSLAKALDQSKDRRPIFFAIMFAFLSAMFVIVFSNNLSWLLCGWEVTTVCSFALIGYTRTPEAIKNSFKAITINLAGGLAFAVALILLGSLDTPIMELDKLIANGSAGITMLPILLLAFAGFTKAAQVPFQSWLLGAMVAPTPTSALLHSSTMVKAGVFLLIKLAPTFGWNVVGMMVIAVGALTFLYCSAVAITQSNAKRVLAYSTVANLGLIVCCAGVGTPEAVWAAIFLLIFHAVAKSLLFCCVGTAEHHIGSRDIESMDNLFTRMPTLALLMALGMLCMFVAPFGMLIGKWATLVSMVDSGHFELLMILAFGSALTFVFWAKWLGKVLAISNSQDNLEKTVHRFEWVGLALMALLILLVTVSMPSISTFVVIPYLEGVATIVPNSVSMTWSNINPALSLDNLLIMAIIMVALLAAFTIQFGRRRKTPTDTVYLGGVSTNSGDRSFKNALGGVTQASQRNWYMEAVFGEKVLQNPANILASALMILFFLMACIVQAGVL